jgi:alpha,alpha-trehalase
VLLSEDSNERRYYRQALQYFDEHVLEQPHFRRFYNPRTYQLTPAFYKSDRSVRESGFDLSGKYGPFGVEIIDHAPVGLNTLLYQMEQDMANMERELGHDNGAERWESRADKRAKRIDRYFWDPELGYFFDYNYRQHRRRPYVFATTFLPLWAGLASEEQAERIVANLHNLESPGGIKTSTYVTGSQWDAPFGWAPLQYFAIHGLRRYGYNEHAERLAGKFVAMLNEDFKFYGVLMEKYDVETCQSHVTHEIRRGYRSNEIGFGWTNGVYLDFVNNVLR